MADPTPCKLVQVPKHLWGRPRPSPATEEDIQQMLHARELQCAVEWYEHITPERRGMLRFFCLFLKVAPLDVQAEIGRIYEQMSPVLDQYREEERPHLPSVPYTPAWAQLSDDEDD